MNLPTRWVTADQHGADCRSFVFLVGNSLSLKQALAWISKPLQLFLEFGKPYLGCFEVAFIHHVYILALERWRLPNILFFAVIFRQFLHGFFFFWILYVFFHMLILVVNLHWLKWVQVNSTLITRSQLCGVSDRGIGPCWLNYCHIGGSMVLKNVLRFKNLLLISLI